MSTYFFQLIFEKKDPPQKKTKEKNCACLFIKEDILNQNH